MTTEATRGIISKASQIVGQYKRDMRRSGQEPVVDLEVLEDAIGEARYWYFDNYPSAYDTEDGLEIIATMCEKYGVDTSEVR